MFETQIHASTSAPGLRFMRQLPVVEMDEMEFTQVYASTSAAGAQVRASTSRYRVGRR